MSEKGEETWKNLKHLLRGEFEIKLPALTENFVAKDKFRKDSREVKFHGFFGRFEEDFLSGDGKIEEPLGKQELRYGYLIKLARDLPAKEGGISIIPELGGEAKAETFLTELYNLLKKQGNGEKEGYLLSDGRANIFYIKNIYGVLRAVNVRWDGDGWHVYSYSVERADGWPVGSRVFFRDS